MHNDPSGNASGNHDAVKYIPYLRLMLTVLISRSQIFYLFICEMGLLKILGSILGHQRFTVPV